MEERFGISRFFFDDYLLFKKNKSWWLLSRSEFITRASILKVWVVGFKAFQRVGEYIKPTTRLIQSFGYHATKAVFNINSEGIKKLADGYAIYTDMALDDGYIILSLNNINVGLGLYIDGKITSQIPRRDLDLFTL